MILRTISHIVFLLTSLSRNVYTLTYTPVCINFRMTCNFFFLQNRNQSKARNDRDAEERDGQSYFEKIAQNGDEVKNKNLIFGVDHFT